MEKGLRNTLIVSGILGGLAVAGYTAYRSIIKALDFDIKPQGAEITNKNAQGVTMKLRLGIVNPSDLRLEMKRQEYDVYLNGIFISRLKSDVPQILYPHATSTFTLDLDLNYKDILAKLNVATGQGFADKLSFITNLRDQRLKLDSKLSIKYGILPTIPIDYAYEDTLRGWGM